MANGYLHLTTDYGHTMAKSLILYSPNSYPNTKSQIYFPLKCPKSLVFYTNKSWWMKNHGQGTQWKHVCRNLNRKYPKYPSTYSAHSPVIWVILEKKSSSHVHCPCTWQNFRCEKVCCVPPKVSSVLGTFGRHDVHHLIANFFYVQNWQKPTGSQIFSSIPLPDVRGCQEKIWKKSRWRNNWMCVW